MHGQWCPTSHDPDPGSPATRQCDWERGSQEIWSVHQSRASSKTRGPNTHWSWHNYDVKPALQGSPGKYQENQQDPSTPKMYTDHPRILQNWAVAVSTNTPDCWPKEPGEPSIHLTPGDILPSNWKIPPGLFQTIDRYQTTKNLGPILRASALPACKLSGSTLSSGRWCPQSTKQWLKLKFEQDQNITHVCPTNNGEPKLILSTINPTDIYPKHNSDQCSTGVLGRQLSY